MNSNEVEHFMQIKLDYFTDQDIENYLLVVVDVVNSIFIAKNLVYVTPNFMLVVMEDLHHENYID